MLSIIRGMMFILLALMTFLTGMALLAGDNAESPTIVTYDYRLDRLSAAFYLKDERYGLVIAVIQHPCLMELKDRALEYPGWIRDGALHSGWKASVMYDARTREIHITDYVTGLTCPFTDYRRND